MVAVEPEINPVRAYAFPQSTQAFSLTHFDRRFLVIALGTLLVVRILAMFWLPLVDTTEARYAEIARIMLETGDWITPQFDYGVPFWGKPPLHTWLSAAGMAIFGVGAFGARIFILATALGVLGLTFVWVRQHKGIDQALLSVVVLFTSVLFFGASAFVMTDMVMVLGLTLSMVGFYNCLVCSSLQSFWGRAFFVGIAIGLLAKGPVALVLMVLPIVPWLVLTGNWRNLAQLPWRLGLGIAALLTLPWYVAAELKTPGFIHYFIVGEHFQRFVMSGWEGDLYGSGHARPLGIIWLYWVAAFLPWTFFAIPMLLQVRSVPLRAPQGDEGWHSYLILWILSPLLLFTPAANLLSAYVLPSLPATAVLLVSVWARVCGKPGRWARISAVGAIGVVATLFVSVSVLAYGFPQTLKLKSERHLVAFARAVDPNIEFTYWGQRSFSADFYTQNTADFTILTSALAALTENGVRDAVAIEVNGAAEQLPFLEDHFDRAGVFGRRVLFLEKEKMGDAS